MLSKRLLAIANMINKDMIVADIGCDHAFLCVYLVSNGICQKTYASDNKIGPLNQAKKSINEAGLEDKIICTLNDGLDNLSDDVNCLVLAGMGAELIVDILSKHPEYVNKMSEIVVQANTSVFKVREFISTNKYKIIDEKIVIEADKYYEIIKFTPLEKETYNTDDIWLGPILKKNINDVYRNYIHKRFNTLKYISQANKKIKDSEEYLILEKFIKEYL